MTIEINGTLVDLAVDDRGQGLAVLTHDENKSTRLRIFAIPKSGVPRLTRDLRLPDGASKIFFVPGHPEYLLLVIPDGNLTLYRLVRFLSLKPIERVWTLSIPQKAESAIVEPTSDYIAISKATEARLLRLEDGGQLEAITLPDTISAMHAWPDGSRLAVGCIDGSVQTRSGDGDAWYPVRAPSSAEKLHLSDHSPLRTLVVTPAGDLFVLEEDGGSTRLPLGLKNCLGILDVADGWVAWSKHSAVTITAELTWNVVASSQEIVAAFCNRERQSILVIADPLKQWLRLVTLEKSDSMLSPANSTDGSIPESGSTPITTTRVSTSSSSSPDPVGPSPSEAGSSPPSESPSLPTSTSTRAQPTKPPRNGDDTAISSASRAMGVGISACHSGHLAKALGAFEAVIASDPISTIAQYLAAEIDLEFGRIDRAEAGFAAAIGSVTASSEIEELIAAGCSAIRLRDLERANDLFAKVLEKDPKNTIALNCAQSGRAQVRTAGEPSYPDTIEFIGFRIPLPHLSEARLENPVPVPDTVTQRCFIMPSRSITIDERRKQHIFYSAALPPSEDAGYRLSEGDIGFFYDQRRNVLIGPYVAKSPTQQVSMPLNLEKIRQQPKRRTEIALDLNPKASIIAEGGKILRSFGFELKSTDSRELYLADPVIEGDNARRFLSQTEKIRPWGVSGANGDRRTEKREGFLPGIRIDGTLIDVAIDPRQRRLALATRDKNQAYNLQVYAEGEWRTWLLVRQVCFDHPVNKIHFVPDRDDLMLLEISEEGSTILVLIEYTASISARTVWKMTIPHALGPVAVSKYQVAYHVPSEHKLHVVKMEDERDATSLWIHQNITGIQFSEYGARIAAGCDDGTILVMNNCSRIQWSRKVHGSVQALLYNNSTRTLLTATDTGQLFYFQKGRKLHTVSLPVGSIKGIAETDNRWLVWSPDAYASIENNLTWRKYVAGNPIVHVLCTPKRHPVLFTRSTGSSGLRIDYNVEVPRRAVKVDPPPGTTARDRDAQRRIFGDPSPNSGKTRAESERQSCPEKELSENRRRAFANSDLFERAIAACRAERYDAALEAVESAIKQDPQSLVARYLVAEICLKRGENERAEKQFPAAIPPLGTRVLKEEALVAGFAALRLLDYDRANDIFSKLHAADPKNTTAWYGLQIARDRGQTPDSISYPETAEVAGFPIPLHEIAGIHSYTPVNGPEEIRERYFIMPGHSRTIDACEESLVFHTPVQRSVDSGYRVAKGDIGYFYDLGRDSLSGPYFAESAPHFAQMPPDHRSERASGPTKNVLAIPLAMKGDVRVTGGAGAILESLEFKLMKTHTGELYLPDPVLVGDHAKRFARLVTTKKARAASYSPGEYIMITDGGFKGQRARVKEIDEEMDKIVVELDGVLLPVPIPLRVKQVSKERR